jgi:hypothetical protein
LQKYPIYFKVVILIVEAIRASLADTTAGEKEEKKRKLNKR